MHVHNFFPRLSPSVYDAAADFGIPVIQTLHNYRLLCANAQLFREGAVCRECLGRAVPWPAVQHGCYQDSRAGSAVVAGMLAAHRLRGTWRDRVDRYIVLTEFARQLFREHTNIPSHKLVVKPNSSPDVALQPRHQDATQLPGRFVLYAGRLTPEKGIPVLLRAVRTGLAFPLVVAGTGPLQGEVEAAHARGELYYLGAQDASGMQALMQQATALLVPSLWFEGLPMVIAEAFSASLPVLASNVGSLATLIHHETNGLHAEAGSSTSIAAAVRRLREEPELLNRMRKGARESYLAHYHPSANTAMLHSIYRSAIAERAVGTSRVAGGAAARVAH